MEDWQKWAFVFLCLSSLSDCASKSGSQPPRLGDIVLGKRKLQAHELWKVPLCIDVFSCHSHVFNLPSSVLVDALFDLAVVMKQIDVESRYVYREEADVVKWLSWDFEARNS